MSLHRPYRPAQGMGVVLAELEKEVGLKRGGDVRRGSGVRSAFRVKSYESEGAVFARDRTSAQP